MRGHPGISAFDLVKEVTTKKPFTWQDSVWKWQLPQKEKDQLYFEWLKKVVKKVEYHENELKKNHPKRS